MTHDHQTDDAERLATLLRRRHACVSIVTHEEAEALQTVRQAAMNAGLDVLTWSIDRGVTEGLVEGAEAIPESEHPAAALFALTRAQKPCAAILLDLAGHLEDARTLRLARRVIEHKRSLGGALILIDHQDNLPPVIKAHATEFTLSFPDEQEIERIVRHAVRAEHDRGGVEIDLTRSALRAIIRNLSGLTRRQIEQIATEMVSEDRRLDAEDVNTALARKRSLLEGSGLLEYIEAPATLDSIGGLDHLKQWLAHREGAVGERAEEYGLRPPRGVLMLGVQGAGKSLCAKAIATAWARPLLRLDPGSLYDRYIGESERRLRDALQQAELMAPIILWIDEIEKGFAGAASKSTDGGLSKRMFGTLLTWMQEHTQPVFLVATANDIEALPPELLRKGRFDEIFFVDLPKDASRKQIFAIHLEKRGRDVSNFDLDALAAASDGYSGAEIEQAIVSALHDAFASGSDVTTEGIVTALRNSPPLSVTMREKVASLRQWAQDRCVPAE